ncbi:MAG: AAA family ATPase [Microcystaceae cyanobacterium]
MKRQLNQNFSDYSQEQREALARTCLLHIDPKSTREEWVKVATALKTVNDDLFYNFDEWSQWSPDQYNAKDCRDTWKSAKPETVNLPYLVSKAKYNGFDLRQWQIDQGITRQGKGFKKVGKPTVEVKNLGIETVKPQSFLVPKKEQTDYGYKLTYHLPFSTVSNVSGVWDVFAIREEYYDKEGNRTVPTGKERNKSYRLTKKRPENEPLEFYGQRRLSMSGSKWCLVVEGETMADELWKVGIPAVSPQGSWKGEDLEAFAKWVKKEGIHLVMCPDNDQTGKDKMLKLVKAMDRQGVNQYNMVDILTLWEDCPNKGDLKDWIQLTMSKQDIDVEKCGKTLAEWISGLIEGGYIPDWMVDTGQPLTGDERLDCDRNLKQLRFIVYDELVNTPDIKFIVPQYFANQSVSMVYGESGVGKSFLAYNLAKSLLEGSDFLDQPVPDCNDVLVIQMDEPLPTTKTRWESLGLLPYVKRNALNLVPVTEGFTLTKENIALLDESLKANPQISFVIIDNLLHGISGTGIDINSSQVETDIIIPLQRIATRYDCHITILHHTKKGEPETFYGSNTIKNALSYMGCLIKTRSGRIALKDIKQRNCPEMREVSYILNENGLIDSPMVMCGGNDGFDEQPVPTPTERNDSEVFLLLAKNHPNGLTVNELVEESGMTKRTVQRHLKQLEEKGLILSEKIDSRGTKRYYLKVDTGENVTPSQDTTTLTPLVPDMGVVVGLETAKTLVNTELDTTTATTTPTETVKSNPTGVNTTKQDSTSCKPERSTKTNSKVKIGDYGYYLTEKKKTLWQVTNVSKTGNLSITDPYGNSGYIEPSEFKKTNPNGTGF